ncbi:L-type lectin family protein [Companilactobacillus kedongensis]|uniref:lectin-like domain-containing protein n=1 Tax=Companilactobacillus kedongensis TaxID=2486004 RepID=UPI000F787E2B|nr:hypothetical protein [Companilactobacillus kedongensis]
MRKNTTLRYIWVISAIVLFGVFFESNQSLKTVIADTDYPVSNAPAGLKFSDYFKNGTVPTNNASIISSNDGNTGIVQLTKRAQNQQSYVWSNPDSMNYFNLKAKQTLSMWIYLDNRANPGDGMAFVLQNSGFDAAAKLSNGETAKGQTMGVWGSDDSYKSSTTSDDVAAKAIQNSWALEFDTFENNNNSGASMFDNGIATDANYKNYNTSFDGQLGINSIYSHIAYNYPGEATTYMQHSDKTANDGNSYYPNPVQTYWYSMAHKGLKSTSNNKGLSLSDGMWHHVVISYQPPVEGSNKGHLSYTFDDKIKTADLFAPKKQQPVSDSNIEINTDNFYKNSTQQFGRDTGKILWGFTGTTGASYARNMVIFESIPSLVEGTVSSNIYDDSQAGKELTSTDDKVYNGDNMRFVYNLKRDSGELDWKDINAVINLPDNMDYTGGTIAYSDGTIDNISASDLSSGTFTRTLKNLLKSGDPNSATVTINGVTNATKPTADTNVAATTASFNGSDLLKNVDLQGFTIKATTMKLVPDSTNLDLGSKESVDAMATASYIDPSVVMNNSKVTVHYKLNDGTEKTQALASGSNGKISINVVKADLNDGDNKLTAYVTDSDGNRSNSVTYSINKPTIAPILIDADSNMSFRTVHSNGKDQMVKRNGSWKINVVDNTDPSDWKLTASAVQDPSSDTFDGDLLYVDNTGVTQSVLNGSIVQIADKSTFPSNFVSDGKTYQVANTWDNDDGILLKANSTAKKGNYKYDVTWNLTDSL